MNRKPTQDDLNAAARGLRMIGMSITDLRALAEEHRQNPLFASQVIVAAARQLIAVRLAMGAR